MGDAMWCIAIAGNRSLSLSLGPYSKLREDIYCLSLSSEGKCIPDEISLKRNSKFPYNLAACACLYQTSLKLKGKYIGKKFREMPDLKEEALIPPVSLFMASF